MKKSWYLNREIPEILGSSNLILKGDGYYISYNPITFPDYKEETALYDFKTDLWHILLGDFRKEYEEAHPSREKSLQVYQNNISRRSKWSTDDPPGRLYGEYETRP